LVDEVEGPQMATLGQGGEQIVALVVKSEHIGTFVHQRLEQSICNRIRTQFTRGLISTQKAHVVLVKFHAI